MERMGEVVEQQVTWIERITFHVQDGHRNFQSWCGECRRRRSVAFLEVSLLGMLLVFLAAYPWMLEMLGK